MNRKQKVSLWIGFVLVAGSGAFPPWIQSWDFVVGGQDVRFQIGPGAEGYSWIHRPPQVPRWVDEQVRKPDDKELADNTFKGLLKAVRTPAGLWRARVAITRLLVEWAVLLFGTLCAFHSFAGGSQHLKPKPTQESPASAPERSVAD